MQLTSLVSQLENPTDGAHAGDQRLFIAQRGGQILIYDGLVTLPTPFLDISDRVSIEGVEGLLGITFHPQYQSNGWFFVTYVDQARRTVLARFSVDADNPNRALSDSEAVLLRVEKPIPQHHGGQVKFGPDGMLWWSTGDGGGLGEPSCAASDPASLNGKILRLDVDRGADQEPYYTVPVDNPHLGDEATEDEIWARGLRNPWRFAFDFDSGDLWIADVGEDEREEVNRVSGAAVASSPGLDFGWKMMEGTLCTNNPAGCAHEVPNCHDQSYWRPLLEYDHRAGDCSITGGLVYRGDALPTLAGRYVFGDYCSGRIWAMTEVDGAWGRELIAQAPGNLTAFAEDIDGELYALVGDGLYRLEEGVGEPLETCIPGPTTLCLEGGRFRVELTWRTRAGAEGSGQAQQLTDETGYFWFFNAENAEVLVKVKDACVDPFQHFWVFASGLTNVEVDLVVTDTVAESVRRWSNPLGQAFVSVQETEAFATCDASLAAPGDLSGAGAGSASGEG
ncbi:MAG: PQQ-dependent sugar dehydrogenase [Acidobacteriota bacterium]